MDVFKLLTIATAVIALVQECDAQNCTMSERGKDLVRETKRVLGETKRVLGETKRVLGKFPRHWPGRSRWKTICPVRKRFLTRADKETRFSLATRTFHAYVELLKGIYLDGEVLYGKCSSTNQTRISLGRIQEKLDFFPNNVTDRNIMLTPATVGRMSAWRVLKEMQRFGKCVRDRTDNCDCAEKVFSGCQRSCKG